MTRPSTSGGGRGRGRRACAPAAAETAPGEALASAGLHRSPPHRRGGAYLFCTRARTLSKGVGSVQGRAARPGAMEPARRGGGARRRGRAAVEAYTSTAQHAAPAPRQQVHTHAHAAPATQVPYLTHGCVTAAYSVQSTLASYDITTRELRHTGTHTTLRESPTARGTGVEREAIFRTAGNAAQEDTKPPTARTQIRGKHVQRNLHSAKTNSQECTIAAPAQRRYFNSI